MKKMISTLITPRVEYMAAVWPPHKKKDKRKFERIQRIVTKMAPGPSRMSNETELEGPGSSTPEERREKGNLISLYKETSGLEILDRNYLIKMEGRQQPRGHGKALRVETCLKDLKLNVQFSIQEYEHMECIYQIHC